MIEDKALALLERVEGMIDYLSEHEPERMDRPGMVALYLDAKALRDEFYRLEGELSDPGENSPGILRSDPHDTEEAAAYAVQPKTGTQRMAVLEAFARLSPEGLTDEELREMLNLRYSSGCARRGELVKGGWLRDSGSRRPTSTGQDAIVWTLSNTGRLRLAQGDAIPVAS